MIICEILVFFWICFNFGIKIHQDWDMSFKAYWRLVHMYWTILHVYIIQRLKQLKFLVNKHLVDAPQKLVKKMLAL